jgi:dCMP deaminase
MSANPAMPPEYRAFPATADDLRWIDLIVDELHGWPKHRGTKHVAVITGPDGSFRSLGFNGLPRGVDDGNPAFAQHPLKREMTMCAERNALRNMAIIGLSARGCTLHADAVPCAACAREIVESGIATVVMVNADVPSRTHGDAHWQGGLQILLDHGVEIRQHDASVAKYGAATRKIDHPPIASGSVDWDSRYLALAQYLSQWSQKGTGEVVARRPELPPKSDDKIVRALGCWTPYRPQGAVEIAQNNGVSLQGCTLYAPGLASLLPIRLALTGIAGIIVADTPQNRRDLKEIGPGLAKTGIAVGLHKVTPQDYASLVKAQYPQLVIDLAPAGAIATRRNEEANHVV